MNIVNFTLAGAQLAALASGALWWPEKSLLCVSDLHLGKADRIVRKGGAPLPPYETHDTLLRLSGDLYQTNAKIVICLGDSFDDLGATFSLSEDDKMMIARLQSGRRWIWVEGNHDPGPIELGGTHHSAVNIGPLAFRHIAMPSEEAEISGHYHPKARIFARGRAISRPAFLYDDVRVVLPAYGTYTGGLDTTSKALSTLMRVDARAILTGKTPLTVPMPR
ncbi:MAG: ligase-associated DNA damage response endonuclease PdeM [Pseudomonadota bacterium]